jgi:hypothetical protein
MNLTTPPEVVDLSADRSEQLRAGLIAVARRQTDPPPRDRPAWLPIAAAATGVVTVAVGIAVVPRLGGPTPPVSTPATPLTSSSPTPTRQTALAKKWKVPPSTRVIPTDLGPVDPDEAWRAAGKCWGVKPGEERKRLRITWSRWMLEPAWYDGERWHGTPRRKIVQAIESADRLNFGLCDDGFLRSSGGGPTPWEPHPSLSILDGGGTGKVRPSFSNDPGEPWGVGGRLEGYRSVGSGEARVEMRVIWPGGTSPWYRGYVAGDTAFVEAVTYSAIGSAPAVAALEARTFDATGRLIETRVVTG